MFELIQMDGERLDAGGERIEERLEGRQIRILDLKGLLERDMPWVPCRAQADAVLPMQAPDQPADRVTGCKVGQNRKVNLHVLSIGVLLRLLRQPTQDEGVDLGRAFEHRDVPGIWDEVELGPGDGPVDLLDVGAGLEDDLVNGASWLLCQ